MSTFAYAVLIITVIVIAYYMYKREPFEDSTVCTLDQWGQPYCYQATMRDSAQCGLDAHGLPTCTANRGDFGQSVKCGLDQYGKPFCQ